MCLLGCCLRQGDLPPADVPARPSMGLLKLFVPQAHTYITYKDAVETALRQHAAATAAEASRSQRALAMRLMRAHTEKEELLAHCHDFQMRVDQLVELVRTHELQETQDWRRRMEAEAEAERYLGCLVRAFTVRRRRRVLSAVMQQMTRSTDEARQRLADADAYHTMRQREAAVKKWTAATQERKLYKFRMERIREWRRRIAFESVFSAWRRHAREQRALIQGLYESRVWGMLSSHFSAWRTYAGEQNALMSQKVARHWRARSLAYIFTTWRTRADNQKALVARANAWGNTRAVRKGLSVWRQYARTQSSIAKVMNRMAAKRITRCIIQWHNAVVDRRRVREQEQRGTAIAALESSIDTTTAINTSSATTPRHSQPLLTPAPTITTTTTAAPITPTSHTLPTANSTPAPVSPHSHPPTTATMVAPLDDMSAATMATACNPATTASIDASGAVNTNVRRPKKNKAKKMVLPGNFTVGEVKEAEKVINSKVAEIKAPAMGGSPDNAFPPLPPATAKTTGAWTSIVQSDPKSATMLANKARTSTPTAPHAAPRTTTASTVHTSGKPRTASSAVAVCRGSPTPRSPSTNNAAPSTSKAPSSINGRGIDTDTVADEVLVPINARGQQHPVFGDALLVFRYSASFAREVVLHHVLADTLNTDPQVYHVQLDHIERFNTLVVAFPDYNTAVRTLGGLSGVDAGICEIKVAVVNTTDVLRSALLKDEGPQSDLNRYLRRLKWTTLESNQESPPPSPSLTTTPRATTPVSSSTPPQPSPASPTARSMATTEVDAVIASSTSTPSAAEDAELPSTTLQDSQGNNAHEVPEGLPTAIIIRVGKSQGRESMKAQDVRLNNMFGITDLRVPLFQSRTCCYHVMWCSNPATKIAEAEVWQLRCVSITDASIISALKAVTHEEPNAVSLLEANKAAIVDLFAPVSTRKVSSASTAAPLPPPTPPQTKDTAAAASATPDTEEMPCGVWFRTVRWCEPIWEKSLGFFQVHLKIITGQPASEIPCLGKYGHLLPCESFDVAKKVLKWHESEGYMRCEASIVSKETMSLLQGPFTFRRFDKIEYAGRAQCWVPDAAAYEYRKGFDKSREPGADPKLKNQFPAPPLDYHFLHMDLAPAVYDEDFRVIRSSG